MHSHPPGGLLRVSFFQVGTCSSDDVKNLLFLRMAKPGWEERAKSSIKKKLNWRPFARRFRPQHPLHQTYACNDALRQSMEHNNEGARAAVRTRSLFGLTVVVPSLLEIENRNRAAAVGGGQGDSGR